MSRRINTGLLALPLTLAVPASPQAVAAELAAKRARLSAALRSRQASKSQSTQRNAIVLGTVLQIAGVLMTHDDRLPAPPASIPATAAVTVPPK